MDLKLLEDIVALDDAGGFGKAARERGITQPAFSKRIRALENWVGTTLVDRHSHPIALTDAGRLFVESARQISRALNSARDEVRARAGVEPDKIVLSAAMTLSQVFFPRWVTELGQKSAQPRFRVKHHSDYKRHIIGLHEREADYYLGYERAASEAPSFDATGLIWKKVGRSSLFPVCATDKAGEPLFPLNAPQTVPVPYISRTDGSLLGSILEKEQAGWRLSLDEFFEVTSTLNLLALVKEGHGVAWLTPECMAEDLTQGHLVRASADYEIPLEVRLYRLDTRIGSAAECLWSMI